MKKLSDIKKIAVIGAGTMGPGIAQVFAMGGYRVALADLSNVAIEKAKADLYSSLCTFAEEDAIENTKIDEIYQRVSFSTDIEESVKDADFIQECIVERKDAKESLYKQLTHFVREDAIIASNTSAMNVFEIVPESLLPKMFICHWYAPPQLIPLVEVVKSDLVPKGDAEMVVELLNSCGKTAVLMQKFIQGYIVNRLQQCLNREVFFLLDNGYCDAEAIDLAAKASFIPRACVLGLCKRADFGGLDITANNYINHSYTMPKHGDELPKTLEKLVSAGNLGIKTGKGLYDYSGQDMKALQAKRDKQLMEIFKLEKKFLDDPV